MACSFQDLNQIHSCFKCLRLNFLKLTGRCQCLNNSLRWCLNNNFQLFNTSSRLICSSFSMVKMSILVVYHKKFLNWRNMKRINNLKFKTLVTSTKILVDMVVHMTSQTFKQRTSSLLLMEWCGSHLNSRISTNNNLTPTWWTLELYLNQECTHKPCLTTRLCKTEWCRNNSEAINQIRHRCHLAVPCNNLKHRESSKASNSLFLQTTWCTSGETCKCHSSTLLNSLPKTWWCPSLKRQMWPNKTSKLPNLQMIRTRKRIISNLSNLLKRTNPTKAVKRSEVIGLPEHRYRLARRGLFAANVLTTNWNLFK